MELRRPLIVVDRYFWIELAFFIGLFILMPMVTDVEYAFNEEPYLFKNNAFYVEVVRRLVWGIFRIVPYYVFYKLAIQELLIKKRFGWFLLSFVVLVFFLEPYTIYVMYWSITKMTFLPNEIVNESAKWMKHTGKLHFTISYLILQQLQLIALAYFIDHDKQHKQLQVLKLLQTETDLKYLKAQLQPHFFFNTLNNIYSLALQQSALTAPLVARLSDMMRYVMEETVYSSRPLTDEINFLHNYVEVQRVRFNDAVRIRFDTQGILHDAMIAPMLLVPFVENAFKHGVEEMQAAGFVDIVVVLSGKELTLSVQNSKSKTRVTVVPGMGIGISNTQKRLALLYPDRHSLVINDSVDDFSIVLTVLLH